MRVFLTGATGFIGTAVARELLGAGHTVLGVARTDEGAEALAAAGVAPHRGDLNDHASFIAGARACEAVIHCAFIHDFARFVENMAIEQQTVVAMLDALAGSGMPFIATSGVAMLAPGRTATEDDMPARQGRGETEALVREAAGRGLRTAVIRLPPITHDSGTGGFLPPLVNAAREKGVAAFVGDGANRWPAGNRLDAARLYRLALEQGEPGAVYHAVDDEGLAMREIAEAIGRRLGLPTASVTAQDAPAHFGWLGMFAGVDMPASAALTRERLGWRPTHPGLIEDIETAAVLTGASI
ncbi:MAG TPA: SDR family oxidoreductase [Caulobacteraceae bacterium]|nr:SDR family oxidoreductase [Caulobacteraceae bacterium]